MEDFRLTERQQKFVEEHHNVLEDFLKYRGLSQDEFYDVVVFRFLRAVKQYDEREDLRKYTFNTIAKHHMCSALGNYFAHLRQQNKNVQVLSLDCPMSYGSGLTFGECIADASVNICEDICKKLSQNRKRYRLLHISLPVVSTFKNAA